MKKIICIFTLLLFSTCSISADIFNGIKPVEFTKGSVLSPGTTVAGYPIFNGDGKWLLQNVTASTATTTSSSSQGSGLGRITLAHIEQGDWVANLLISVSTSPAGGNVYVSGNPCDGSHIVVVSKSQRMDDNCLTIDATNFQSGNRLVTFFNVVITQTRSGGRRYIMTFQLNAEMFGFRDTAPSDWNVSDTLQKSPSRINFISNLKKWAELLQNGSADILAYSKPQNVFDGIPSYSTLLPVPSDLADGSFSQSFISAVESTKYKSKFRAIAYVKLASGRTRWNSQWGSASQEIAEKIALEKCESGRAENTEPCKLYDLDKAMEKISLIPKVGSPSMTSRTQPNEGTTSVEQRLIELQKLLDKGLINIEIFNQKRDEILKSL